MSEQLADGDIVAVSFVLSCSLIVLNFRFANGLNVRSACLKVLPVLAFASVVVISCQDVPFSILFLPFVILHSRDDCEG